MRGSLHLLFILKYRVSNKGSTRDKDSISDPLEDPRSFPG